MNNQEEKISEEEQKIIEIHKLTHNFRLSGINNNFIPAIFKKINSEKIKLSKEFSPLNMTLEKAINDRISRRNFHGRMSIGEVGQLLDLSVGFKKFVDIGEYGVIYTSNIPSAGSRHPLEFYFCAKDVDGLGEGIYHYDIENHFLETISKKPLDQAEVSGAIGNQQVLTQANLLLFITAVHRRTYWKYGNRSYRFIHLEAGHASQNFYLASEAMKLGACSIGGWDDNIANKLLKIDGQREFIVYVMAIGKIG